MFGESFANVIFLEKSKRLQGRELEKRRNREKNGN